MTAVAAPPSNSATGLRVLLVEDDPLVREVLSAALDRRHGAHSAVRAGVTQVWGFEHYDLNLVEVHICALRRKLEEHGKRLIHTVRGVGYVLRP
jgi:DNA-binding response OmpR family regulator